MKTLQSFSKTMALLLLIIFISCNTKPNKQILQTKSEWSNRKFSMFIHWGLYSIPAGMWDNKKITGYSEQIKGHANIPTNEYRKLAKQFNPTKWNPDSIVLLAKKAGMKSIIITSKHHDGFCMFDTQYSDFNIVKATPYKRDILKELSNACKKYNICFGVYFSLIDWDYPKAMPFSSVRNSDSIPPAHHQYNLNQIRELLTNYGDISEIWFDMGSPTYKQSSEIRQLVKQLQPNCMISGRIWNNQGDFVVMGDNYKPEFKMGVPWQTPASIFTQTWGYRSWQVRNNINQKIHEKILDLINIVSSGGNYLLNIGPKGNGQVVNYEKQVLIEIGKWIKTNKEAIYETTTTPIGKQNWGYTTSKDQKLFLHIIDIPKNKKLTIKGLDINITKIYPLNNTNILLESTHKKNTLTIDLSPVLFNKYATVIAIEYKNNYQYIPLNTITANINNTFNLNTLNCEKYHSYSGHDYYSTKPTVVKMRWNILNNYNQNYKLKVKYKSNSKEKLCLCVNEQNHILNTNSEIINTIQLKPESINCIELVQLNQNNPHKDLGIENLDILLVAE